MKGEPFLRITVTSPGLAGALRFQASVVAELLDEVDLPFEEDADVDFVNKVKEGDFVVGGNNFGLGSSREHAPLVIKMAGVSAILAKSVARIFFRNAINLGLPVLICDTDKINDGDELEIDLAAGTIKDITNGSELTFGKIPDVMLTILDEGGLIPYIEKHGDIKL